MNKQLIRMAALGITSAAIAACGQQSPEPKPSKENALQCATGVVDSSGKIKPSVVIDNLRVTITSGTNGNASALEDPVRGLSKPNPPFTKREYSYQPGDNTSFTMTEYNDPNNPDVVTAKLPSGYMKLDERRQGDDIRRCLENNNLTKGPGGVF